MKKMRRFKVFSTLAVTFAVASFLLLQTLSAQQFTFSVEAGKAIYYADGTQDDTIAVGTAGGALIVKYMGSQESGTLDMNVNALEFFSGALGGEVINGDSGFDVNTGDVCGTANDSLDVTDAQCDTPAELCLVVNSSGANWNCIVLGVLDTETLATAAEYIDPADAQAKLPGGLLVEIDNSGVDTMAQLMVPWVGRGRDSASSPAPQPFGTSGSGRDNIEPWLNPPAYGSYVQTEKENPFAGLVPVLTGVTALVDSTSGWTLEIYAVKYGRAATPTGSASPGALGTKIYERLVFQADGTDATVLAPTQISGATPIVGAPGETFLVRVTDDALVTATITMSGFYLLNQGR